jgi:sialidase-1
MGNLSQETATGPRWAVRSVVMILSLWMLAALTPPLVLGADQPDHAAALGQTVERPSLPDFAYAKGYQSGITHYLKDNGIFWSVVSERTHPDKRDTEGDIVILADGSLLLAWSDFYTKGWADDSPCRIAMRRSRDGGRTWSPIEVLQGQMGSNVMSVSLLRTSKGTVLFVFLCKNGPDGPCVPYVRRSTDDGKTFGPPILASAGFRNRLANNDHLLEIRDPTGKYGDRGRIVLACRDNPARAGVMVYSDDDGLTWKAGHNVPVRTDWGSQNFNEPGMVELANGRFWMYGRTTMGFHAQSWSDDRGMTWSRPQPMALLGPCSPLIGKTIPETAYTKHMGWAGDLLFTFPNHDFRRYPRRYQYTARTPLDSAVSRDDAKTWTSVRTIEEDPTEQYGYTSIAFQDDDRVGMRVLLTTHVQPIPAAIHRPHALKFLSVPLEWFYDRPKEPQRGIDFAGEEKHVAW